MCRLYGFRSNEPTKVECTLVRAQNALMIQSRRDQRGLSHPDGWGIAVYDDGSPQIERRATAAHEDVHFSTTAERIFAHTVVAHVRQATVGESSMSNTHPFTFGRWVFAHNGTVRGFPELEPTLLEETLPALRELRRGVTDSEMAFLWLMSRLQRAGVDLEAASPDVGAVVEVLAGSVTLLAERCREAAPDLQERLNFMLTDGHFLVVSRWHNGLYYVDRKGLHDCEVCGIPHVHHQPKTRYRAVITASEPISHEDWQEVPEAHVLVVEPSSESYLVAI